MIEKNIRVRLNGGMEFGPATIFVQVASRFKSRIYVTMDNKRVNAKSIMGMLTLGLIEGDEVTVTVDGEDEVAAAEEIEKFLG